ncbi:MAG: efflux RND transporter periplasmic adaptor subunit [Nitrosomonas sp.]|nr:efflux RND transporter periplasmic adaptor subunit [Nitrosomonas sp.]
MKFLFRTHVFVLIAVFFVAACSNGDSATDQPKITETGELVDVNRIALSEGMIQRITVDQLKLIKLADKIHVPSQIRVDEQRLIRVGANVTGRIVEVYANLGDSVNAGVALARIASPELNRAQLDYLRDYSVMQLNERAVNRARLLFESDVIPAAELQRRETELQVSRAELSAAKDQLRLLGVNDAALKELVRRGNILSSVPITVSKNGTVIERNVVAGQVVQPSDPLFKVADLSTVWAVGDVPEQIARNVMVGQHVEIQVPALEDVILDGLIVFVADTVNPVTRTVMVRTVVENPERKLKPSMLASMRIIESPREMLVLPEEAVVREANRDYVYLAEADNHFLRVPVELGPEMGNVRPVLAGVSAGQNIVVSGAYDLDNERKLSELE